MCQNLPPTATPSLFVADPNFRPHHYDRNLLIGLMVWCGIGIILMFFGNAFTDTFGLILLIVEAVVVLVIDRPGFASLNGLINRQNLSNGARMGLNVLEVIFFWLVLPTYLVRAFLYEQRASGMLPPGR